MEPKTINVLLIEDNPNDTILLRKILQNVHATAFEVECAESLTSGLKKLGGHHFDVILLDLVLIESKGMSTFRTVYQRAPQVPIIVLSGLEDETLALETVHAGAQDYLVKGRVDGPLLSRAITYAIERTQAKAAVLLAEEKYRSIFENAVEGIFQTTPDGKYLSVNPALTRIYGYDSTEELVAGLNDIGKLLYVDPQRRTEFIRVMQEKDMVTNFESQVSRRDGTIIWISENARSVRDEKGKLLYYEGTVEDITERKKVQEQLRHSEALYHSLVETLPQNIFRKDLFERFTFANKRFCETLGRPLSEIIGKTDFDFFPEELGRKYQRDDRRIMESGETVETIEEHRPPGGEKLYVQVVKTPLYDSNGALIGLQGIFWDITEKKRAEEREQRMNAELARSREELRKKNDVLEDDLKMAHEIQQAILPQQYPVFPASATIDNTLLRFHHLYHPSEQVGGDFFNVLPLSDTKAGIFICDVMGHGVRSALVTTMVRGLVEELRSIATEPNELLARINRDLRAILQQTGTPFFTTAFYVVADLAKRQFLYTNAGHPKPILLRRKTGESRIFETPSGHPHPALGLFPENRYANAVLDMCPGDTVILFTDGLYEIEGKDEQQYSQEMLLDSIRRHSALPCPALFQAVVNEVKEFSATHTFADDVCLVGIEVSESLK